MGHPIVTIGDFVLYGSCAKMHELIKLPFRVVSEVGQALVY